MWTLSNEEATFTGMKHCPAVNKRQLQMLLHQNIHIIVWVSDDDKYV